MRQKDIKFGKFDFIETWAFPRDVSKFVEWAQIFFAGSSSKWTHICCGTSKIGDLRIDKDPQHKPDIVADIHTLPNLLGVGTQKNIIIDPPWEIAYNDRRAWSYIVRDLLQVGGICLFNAPWSPWVTGLEIVAVYKVAQAFNSYRDLVDWWVLRRT